MWSEIRRSKFFVPLVIGAVLIALTLVTRGTVRKAADVFETAVVQKIAVAIARAEGFYVQNSRAARNHNPGNMTRDLIGKAVGKDGAFVVFRSDEDGWDNLRKQVWLMFGGSSIYHSTMTIAEVASYYTATQQSEWASNVAKALNVSTNTRLSQIA